MAKVSYTPQPFRREDFDAVGFVSAIERTMQARGVSSKELSNLTGISESSLSRMLAGTQMCDAASLSALSSWAGVNPVLYRKGAWVAPLAFPAVAASGQQVEPTDEQLIALNAGERFFSESPTKYPEAGHGTQYHAGAPGVVGFARAAIALAGQQSGQQAESPHDSFKNGYAAGRAAATQEIAAALAGQKSERPAHAPEHVVNRRGELIHRDTGEKVEWPTERSDWEAFQQTEQYQNILRWSDERCNGFTEDDMRQAFQAGERYASEKGAKPPE